MAGGGIGEAMLINAAIGGGAAALTGGDPLKGALLGGISGGVGGALGASGGISGLLGQGGTAAATGAVPAMTQGMTAGAQAAMAPTNFALTGASAMPSVSQGLSGLANATNPAMAGMGGGTGLTVGAGAPGLNLASQAPGMGLASQTPALGAAAMNPSFDVLSAQIAGQTAGMNAAANPSMLGQAWNYIKANPLQAGSTALTAATGAQKEAQAPEKYKGPLSRFKYDPDRYRPLNFAEGGIAALGRYSDGGQLTRGPGDGMSDNIPAQIGQSQPAKLADGEFVVPADVVSHLGNGSTDAGARQLYNMMDKVRTARTGNSRQGREINPGKFMPA